MKALVLKDYKKFSYEDVPKPEIKSGEVLIAVKACGICGSDVHGMDGSTGRRRPPIIMGHEASGMILEGAPDVKTWQVGDRVTFDSTIYCGQCEFCHSGQINLCNHRRVLGVSCEDYRQSGAFAEFVTVPQHVLYRLPDNISYEFGALLEPYTIGLHALRRSPAKANESVVIVGCGTIGLVLVQLTKLAGFRQIIVVDVAPEKLAAAAKLGAHHTINSSGGDPLKEILDLTNGVGADRALEAVGIGATVNLAIRCVRKGGTVVLVGNVAPNVEFPLQSVVTRELSLFGTCASAGEYPACLEMMAKGELNPSAILSAVAPLSEGAGWFDRLYRKEPGLQKVILTPGK